MNINISQQIVYAYGALLEQLSKMADAADTRQHRLYIGNATQSILRRCTEVIQATPECRWARDECWIRPVWIYGLHEFLGDLKRIDDPVGLVKIAGYDTNLKALSPLEFTGVVGSGRTPTERDIHALCALSGRSFQSIMRRQKLASGTRGDAYDLFTSPPVSEFLLYTCSQIEREIEGQAFGGQQTHYTVRYRTELEKLFAMNEQRQLEKQSRTCYSDGHRISYADLITIEDGRCPQWKLELMARRAVGTEFLVEFWHRRYQRLIGHTHPHVAKSFSGMPPYRPPLPATAYSA